MPTWWPFERKKSRILNRKIAEKLQWAEEQMAHGVSRQEVCEQLLKAREQADPGDPKTIPERQALSLTESKIFQVFMDRNDKAQTLENEGKIYEAIELYKMNVLDEFIGRLPYDRLRIIYSQREDYKNAQWVCLAYLRASIHADSPWRSEFEDWNKKYQKLIDSQK